MITSIIKELWRLNVFFWKESSTFVPPWKFSDYIYAPIVWFKFMKYSIKDYNSKS